MQGHVIHVAVEESEGFIRAEDSLRYPYAMSDWISLELASVGALVDFELVVNRAMMVCKVPEIIANQSNRILPIWKKKGFLVAASALALLTIGAGVAYETGMLTGLTRESHGPIKTYQVLKLAKIRNMPTAQNSTVLGELNPGDRFVGRVYLAPDGQSQWIKSEGVEEYVSIVNLAEVPTPEAAPPVIATADGPDDGLIKAKAANYIAKNCKIQRLYDAFWQTFSGDGEYERAREARGAEQRKIIDFIMNDKGMSFSPNTSSSNMYTLYGTYINPEEGQPESLNLEIEVLPSGPFLHISACPYRASEVRVVDRTSLGPKDFDVIWEAAYLNSNVMNFIATIPPTSLSDPIKYFNDPISPGVRGAMHWHKTDLYGWELSRIE